MRLFVAVRVSPAVGLALTEAVEELRRQGRGTFTRPENLHLTLAFLGETDRLEDACRAVEAACACAAPFSLTVEGLGRFEDLWWAGVGENPRLERLALEVREALGREGFAMERRPWRPHITLARRWRGPVPVLEVPRRAMEVRHVSLMESHRAEGRLRYAEVFRAEL